MRHRQVTYQGVDRDQTDQVVGTGVPYTHAGACDIPLRRRILFRRKELAAQVNLLSSSLLL
jgi:hypothetical protein